MLDDPGKSHVRGGLFLREEAGGGRRRVWGPAGEGRQFRAWVRMKAWPEQGNAPQSTIPAREAQDVSVA